MKYVVEPLVAKQRDMYLLPRSAKRFEAYIDLMLNQARDAPVFPALNLLNPMGREHILQAYEQLLDMQAETMIQAELAALTPQLERFAGEFRVGLVVLDDVAGGWTNRYFNEMNGFIRPETKTPASQRHYGDWITVVLWASEPIDSLHVRFASRMAVYRQVFQLEHGLPQTLQAVLNQEGVAAAFAGRVPSLDSEEYDYSAELIAPLAQTTHYPSIMAAYYGDEIATGLGYPSLGLSPYAGLDVGTHLALAAPETWLLRY